MTDKVFIQGMIFKRPHEKAPDFVKGKLSVKVDEFIAFAKEHQNDGWLNVDLKEAQNGKYYAELDNWKPDGGKSDFQAPSENPAPAGGGGFDDDIPFAPLHWIS